MYLRELHNPLRYEDVDLFSFGAFCESRTSVSKDEAIKHFQDLWQDIRKEGGTKEHRLEKLVDAMEDACETRNSRDEILPDDSEDAGAYSSLPGGFGPSVICFYGAEFLRHVVGGKVVGFYVSDNPGTEVEQWSDGHDFLLVDDRYIVDYWVKHIIGSTDKAVLDLNRHADRQIARKLYGLKSKWTNVESLNEEVEIDDRVEDEKVYSRMDDEFKRNRRLSRKMREADTRYRRKKRARLQQVLGAVKGDRITLAEPKSIYHGSPADRVKSIMADGMLKSYEVEKMSGGTLEEEGLIWFATSKEHALGYARGQERKKKGPKHGAIFTVTLSSGTKLINRSAKLTEREAAILDKGNKRRSYDPIRAGMSLQTAMSKLFQHPQSIRTYGEVLPALGYHGLHYGDGFQIGIVSPELPIEEVEMVGEA